MNPPQGAGGGINKAQLTQSLREENTIKGEKGALIIVATALLTTGIKALSTHDYVDGATFIATSVLLFYIRKHFKFRRWSKVDKKE